MERLLFGKAARSRCEESIAVAAKDTCPKCKGQRDVKVRLPQGTVDFVKCPQFAGVGYKICTYAVC